MTIYGSNWENFNCTEKFTIANKVILYIRDNVSSIIKSNNSTDEEVYYRLRLWKMSNESVIEDAEWRDMLRQWHQSSIFFGHRTALQFNDQTRAQQLKRIKKKKTNSIALKMSWLAREKDPRFFVAPKYLCLWLWSPLFSFPFKWNGYLELFWRRRRLCRRRLRSNTQKATIESTLHCYFCCVCFLFFLLLFSQLNRLFSITFAFTASHLCAYAHYLFFFLLLLLSATPSRSKNVVRGTRGPGVGSNCLSVNETN